ncbi:MAG: hypothetical protein QMD22_10695, partial [archaeon]|nr:hypothetical protein [archaeon]
KSNLSIQPGIFSMRNCLTDKYINTFSSASVLTLAICEDMPLKWEERGSNPREGLIKKIGGDDG